MAGTRVEQHLEATGDGRPGGGRRWLVAGLGLLLVAAVGLGSGVPLWDVDGLPSLVAMDEYSSDLLVLGFALLVASPFIIRFLRGRRVRPNEIPDPDVAPVKARWWVRVLVIAILVGAVFLAGYLVSLAPVGERSSGTDEQPAPVGEQPARVQPRVSHPPVHWWLVAAIAGLAAVGVAAALHFREQQPPLEPEAHEREDLLAAVDLSLDDIENETDPRRAVIRAYARMERVLGRHGIARRPSETPFEYLGRALTSLRVGRASVERLTALFEWAKFSQHDVDLAMKDEALAALAGLRDELSGAAA
jgi:hypothetical protein